MASARMAWAGMAWAKGVRTHPCPVHWVLPPGDFLRWASRYWKISGTMSWGGDLWGWQSSIKGWLAKSIHFHQCDHVHAGHDAVWTTLVTVGVTYADSSVFSKTGGCMPLHTSGLWPIYLSIYLSIYIYTYINWKTIASKILYLHYILVLLHTPNLKSGKLMFIHWDPRTKKRHVSHPGGDIKRDWTHLGGAVHYLEDHPSWFCPYTLGRYPKLPQTPKRQEFLHKLLVKHPGYLPGVCGWDLKSWEVVSS